MMALRRGSDGLFLCTPLATWCAHTGVAARLGGDEFAAVVIDAADRLADLRTALHQPIPHAGHLLPVAASIGVAHLADLPAPALTDALTAADRDMYAHKPDGRTTRHR
jgi:diguanylate cyclase (GGDEF)-like protein